MAYRRVRRVRRSGRPVARRTRSRSRRRTSRRRSSMSHPSPGKIGYRM